MADVKPTDQDARELRRLRDKLDRGIKGGEGVSIDNTPTALIIRLRRKRPTPPAAAAKPPLVKPIAKAARYGTYTGVLWQQPAARFDADATGSFVEGDLGTAATGEIVIVNLWEQGAETWSLVDGDTEGDEANLLLPPTLFEATPWGSDKAGRAVYLIGALKPAECGVPT